MSIIKSSRARDVVSNSASDRESKVMYCHKCGQELPPEARYCLRCGEAIAEGVQARKSTGNFNNPLNAILATLGITHLSKKAMDTIIILGFFFIFFGCPIICGTLFGIVQLILGAFGLSLPVSTPIP